MSHGGGDHGQNVHLASMVRARVNARMRGEWVRRERERRKAESAKPLPTVEEVRPLLPPHGRLRRVLKSLGL